MHWNFGEGGANGQGPENDKTKGLHAAAEGGMATL